MFVPCLTQQKNIVDTQSRISKMNGAMEERHTEIEHLTKKELQLQERYQKLITEIQNVLNQKQTLLLKFQGEKAFGGGLDSREKSEFVTLNEKERKLVSLYHSYKCHHSLECHIETKGPARFRNPCSLGKST